MTSVSEQSMQEGKALFQALSACSPVGLFLADAGGNYTYTNDRCQSVCGFTAEEALGAGWARFVHHEDRERVLNDWTATVSAGGEYSNDLRFQTPDGTLRWVHVHSAPLLSPEGDAVGNVGTVEDITQRKEAEAATARLLEQERAARWRAESTERTLAAILDRVPAGIIVLERDGHMVLMNEEGRRISGVAPETVVPVADQSVDYQLREPRTGRPLAPEETPVARALNGEFVERFEYTFRRPGEPVDAWVQATATPLMGADGQITGAVTVFEEVTEQRTQALERDDFLSAAAHDLKSPITTIKGFVQMLERRLERDGVLQRDPTLDYLRRISRTASTMTDLLSELLDLTRLETGEELDLVRSPTDLVALIRTVIDDRQQITDEHHIVFQTPVDRLAGMLDAARIARVVSNLVTNAIKYSPHGGEIRVSLDEERRGTEGWAVLSVEDRGMGIPAHDLPHVFERFYRGENAAQEFTGTGIGLTGAKQIVEQHGGTIEVRSVEGQGSIFVVSLPVVQAEAPGPLG